MSYNLTFLDHGENIQNTFQGINTQLSNIPTISLLFFVGLFIFFQTINRGTDVALITSGLSMTMIGLILWFASLITWQILLIPLIILFAGIIIKAFS